MNNKIEIIKLKPDYDCFPLWGIGFQTVENLDPKELPISQELQFMLYEWQKKFDDTLDRGDPINSGFESDVEERDFDRDGRAIWKRLSQELSGSYKVQYFSIIDRSLHEL